MPRKREAGAGDHWMNAPTIRGGAGLAAGTVVAMIAKDLQPGLLRDLLICIAPAVTTMGRWITGEVGKRFRKAQVSADEAHRAKEQANAFAELEALSNQMREMVSNRLKEDLPAERRAQLEKAREDIWDSHFGDYKAKFEAVHVKLLTTLKSPDGPDTEME